MSAILFGPQARKFLEAAEGDLQKRIFNKIKVLNDNPTPHGSIKIFGEENVYRIRIGDYRVLYEIHRDRNAILIAKIDKRSRVYD